MRILALASVLGLIGGLSAQRSPFGAIKTIRNQRVFPSSVVAADIDLDGVVDLVVGNAFALDVGRGPMSTAILDSTYKVERTEHLPRTSEFGLISHPAVGVGDMNGDLLPDLITVSDKGALSVFLNKGATLSIQIKPRFGLAPRMRRLKVMSGVSLTVAFFLTYAMEVADFTGDGNVDIVLCGEGRLFLETLGWTGVSLLVGDGKGGISSETDVLGGTFFDLCAHDLNGDGAKDLVAIDTKGRLLVALNRGIGKFSKFTMNLSTPVAPRRVAVGDVDSDGHADFLVAGSGATPEISVLYGDVRSMPATRSGVLSITSMKNETIEAMTVADMDGDRHEDLAVLMTSRTYGVEMLWFRGLGKKGFASPISHPLPATIAPSAMPSLIHRMQATDMNGDFNPEIVVASLQDRGARLLTQYVFPNKTPRRDGSRLVGRGTPGEFGLVPQVAPLGTPRVGSRDFGVALSNGPSKPTWAVLLVNARYTPIKFPGLTVNVWPMISYLHTTTSGAPGAGMAVQRFPIPNTPKARFFTWFCQWVVRDDTAKNAFRLSASPALEVFFGS